MSQRVGYIDSMRGFSMLLVVVGHVLLFSFYEHWNPIFIVLNDGLELPIFFFLSGFFIIDSKKKDFISVVRSLKGKFFTFVVGAMIIMLIYCWTTDKNIFNALFNKYKEGYWFTIVLFEFLLVYYLCYGISKAIRVNKKKETLFIISVALIFLIGLLMLMKTSINIRAIRLFGLDHFIFFFYFLFGVAYKRYEDFFNHIFSNRYVMSFLILSFFLLNIYTLSGGKAFFNLSPTLYPIFVNSIGVVVIFFLFKRNDTFFIESAIGKFLNLIGKRTLDVYFLHYFFLPRNLSIIGEWFNQNYNPYIEYLLALIVAILIVFGAIVVGYVIRLSPFLAKLFFNAK